MQSQYKGIKLSDWRTTVTILWTPDAMPHNLHYNINLRVAKWPCQLRIGLHLTGNYTGACIDFHS